MYAPNGAGGMGGGGTGADGFYQSSFGGAGLGPSIGSTAPTNGTSGMGMSMPPHAQPTHNPQYYVPPPPAQDGVPSYDDEPPLLEELGIHVPSIMAKMRAVLNPFSKYESSFADEADMTGPVALGLLLGLLLMLQSKIQFGVIYGLGLVGCISIYVVFNLMSQRGIDLYRSTSILGYALLPIVILSFLAVILPVRKVHTLGIVVGGGCTAWSTTTATKIFVAVLSLQDQTLLVAYPLLLLYVSFAFITVF